MKMQFYDQSKDDKVAWEHVEFVRQLVSCGVNSLQPFIPRLRLLNENSQAARLVTEAIRDRFTELNTFESSL